MTKSDKIDQNSDLSFAPDREIFLSNELSLQAPARLFSEILGEFGSLRHVEFQHSHVPLGRSNFFRLVKVSPTKMRLPYH